MAWTFDRRWRQPWLSRTATAVSCFVLGAVIVVLIVWLLSRPTSPLPANIRSQVHFPIFYPGTAIVVDRSSYKYDPPSGVLSFTAAMPDGQVATFAEQTTPDPFNDIPDYYSKFLTKMYEYTAFDSLQGTVHLAHPQSIGQVAVMNAKGTLVFARVAHDEPKKIWQDAFNHLSVYTP